MTVGDVAPRCLFPVAVVPMAVVLRIQNAAAARESTDAAALEAANLLKGICSTELQNDAAAGLQTLAVATSIGDSFVV